MSDYHEDSKTAADDENRPPTDSNSQWNHESAMYNTSNSNPSNFYTVYNYNEPMSSVRENRESRNQNANYQKSANKVYKSYEGNIKKSIEKFEKIKPDFVLFLAASGKERFDDCLRVGALYYRGHMNEDSREWLKKAEDSSQDIPLEGNEEDFKKFHSTLGDILIKTGEYGEAKIHLEKAWNILEKMDPPDLKFKSWNRANMGQLLTEGPSKDFEQAKEMFYKSLEYKKELGNYRLIGLNYDYLPDFYFRTENYEKAMECAEAALKYTKEFRERYYLEARHLRNRGRIYAKNGDMKKALIDYDNAMEILEEELSQGNALTKLYKEEYLELFGVPWNYRKSY